MARPYKVTIANGEGTANIISGSYIVTSNVPGYNSASISPSSLVIDKTTGSYTLTIEATGTLTLHVTEIGIPSSTPVLGATFIRCKSDGTEVGNIITSDASGNAVFLNVPFIAETGISLYYKQKSSDGDHEFDNTLKNVSLKSNLTTVEVANNAAANRTIILNDKNYNNLPITSGEVTLS